MARRLLPWALAVLALAAIAAAFWVGRGSRGAGTETAAREGGSSRPPFEVIDPGAPAWAPTGRFALPTVGSIFRDHFARAASPLEGIEAVLFSPRGEECLDECPLALRFVGGLPGASVVRRIPSSLFPELRALARAPGMLPELSAWVLKGSEAIATRAGAETTGTSARAPVRALFMAMPRPDLGAATWSVGLSLGDLPDPHFDLIGGEAGDQGGWQLFVSRVESEGTETGARVRGAVAIGHATGKASWRPIPETAHELGAVFGALWGHYGSLPQEIAGLLLDGEGRVFAFGSDLRLRSASEEPELRRALLALLRRA